MNTHLTSETIKVSAGLLKTDKMILKFKENRKIFRTQMLTLLEGSSRSLFFLFTSLTHLNTKAHYYYYYCDDDDMKEKSEETALII